MIEQLSFSDVEAESFLGLIDTYKASTLSAQSDGPHVSFDDTEVMQLAKFLACFENIPKVPDTGGGGGSGGGVVMLKTNIPDAMVSALGESKI